MIDLAPSFFTISGAGFGEPARHRLADRIGAAAAAGFTGMGFQAGDIARELAAGLTFDDIEDLLQHNGIGVTEIEFLTGWAVVDGDRAGAVDCVQTQDQIHRIADRFGGHHLSAGEVSSAGDTFDIDRAAERLAAVSSAAAEHGLLVAVEPFPWSPLHDVATVLRLLDLAGAPNAGLLIDVWHFFNCGAILADLDGIAPGRIAAVQVNDGPRVRENYLWNARNTRWLPGDGELDVVGLLRRTAELGYAGPYCTEVNYPGFRELSAGEAAAQAFTRTAVVLTAAGLDLAP